MDARSIDLKVKVTRHWLPYARKKWGIASDKSQDSECVINFRFWLPGLASHRVCGRVGICVRRV